MVERETNNLVSPFLLISVDKIDVLLYFYIVLCNDFNALSKQLS